MATTSTQEISLPWSSTFGLSGYSPKPTSHLTQDRVLLMNNMSAILAGISFAFCFAVLSGIAILYSKSQSRSALDRLSLRLLVYALVSNCFYSVGYIICVKVGPGFWCIAGVWMIQFWLGITNWLILCIALNLTLVLVYSFNGLVLEKYYLLGTLILNMILTLPPAIMGKFGWDPVLKVCWLASNSTHDRLIWQISTQLLWIMLAVFITAFCALRTIIHLYKQPFISTRVFDKPPSVSSSNSRPNSRAQDSSKTKNTIFPSPGTTASSESSNIDHHRFSCSIGFRRVILRISIYPAVMILLNLVITISDIKISTAEGIHSPSEYALYALYYALYGARGIFYAIMALIDPSILRSVRIWRGLSTNSSGMSDSTFTCNHGPESGTINVQTEIVHLVEFEELSAGGVHGQSRSRKPDIFPLSHILPASLSIASPGGQGVISMVQTDIAATGGKGGAERGGIKERFIAHQISDDGLSVDSEAARDACTEEDTSSTRGLSVNSQCTRPNEHRTENQVQRQI